MDLQISTGDRLYTVVHDLTTTFELLLVVRVEDALTGELVPNPIAIGPDRSALLVKSEASGYVVIAADVDLAFPRLAVDAYDFEVRIRALGYREVALPVHLPAATSLPMPAVTVTLRRVPVRVQGRVVRAAGDHDPIAGARVTIQADDVLALHTPLSHDHLAGAAVRACALNPAGAIKQLTAAVAAGETRLPLSDRLALAPGDVLRLGPPHRLELALIDSLAPDPPNPALPGEVTLRTPLRRTLPAGAEVEEVTPAPGAAATTLARAVQTGEGVLALAAPLAADSVRLEAAASPDVEYHVIGALTDAEGYYRLDGIGITAATFVASAPGFVDLPRAWRIDSTPTAFLNFRLETP